MARRRLRPAGRRPPGTPVRIHPRPPHQVAAPAPKRWPSGRSRPASLAGPKSPTPRPPSRRSRVDVYAPDGHQELKGVDVTLPPGVTAKLAGVPYCPPTAIAAAAANSGAAERGEPELSRQKPGRQRHGRQPAAARRRFRLPARPSSPGPTRGSAFPGGGHPRHGRAVRPRHGRGEGGAVRRSRDRAGPRGLRPDPACLRRRHARHPLGRGQRRPARILPQRDQLLANSPPRARCTAAAPTRPTPAAFSSFRSPIPSSCDNCPAARSFRPKLFLRVFGATRRAKHPRLRAILIAARATPTSAAPRSPFRTRSSSTRRASETICTRVQFAANDCPKKSIYGVRGRRRHCSASRSKGPSTCAPPTTSCRTSSPPSQGQVDIELVGRIDSSKAGIRTTFDRRPRRAGLQVRADPARRQARPPGHLTQPLPEASESDRQLKAQNGKKANKRTKLRTPCKKKHRNKGHRKG